MGYVGLSFVLLPSAIGGTYGGTAMPPSMQYIPNTRRGAAQVYKLHRDGAVHKSGLRNVALFGNTSTLIDHELQQHRT